MRLFQLSYLTSASKWITTTDIYLGNPYKGKYKYIGHTSNKLSTQSNPFNLLGRIQTNIDISTMEII